MRMNMSEERVREIVREELKKMADSLPTQVVEESVKALNYGLARAIRFRIETTDADGTQQSTK